MTWSHTIETFVPATIAEMCKRDGVCLIKGFFDAEEVQRIQDGLIETEQQFGALKPDPLSCPALNWLVVHPRIRETAEALLGQGLVHYTNGSINYEPEIGPLTQSPYTALHTDAAGRPDVLGGYPDRDGETPFPAYRFAIYMQDYTNSSGGVRVAPGSHLWTTDFDTSAADEFSAVRIPPASKPDAKAEEFIHIIPTQPGDLVIWNIALVHGAGAKRLKNDPSRCLHPREEAALTQDDPSQFLPPLGPRNAIFFDYGAISKAVDLYIKFCTQTQIGRRLAPYAVARSDDPSVQDLLGETCLRQDGLLVSLCVQIEDLKTSGGDADVLKALYERLHKIAKQHQEFSTHHSLFDRAKFHALDAANWKQAAGYVQKMVIHRLKMNQPDT